MISYPLQDNIARVSLGTLRQGNMARNILQQKIRHFLGIQYRYECTFPRKY